MPLKSISREHILYYFLDVVEGCPEQTVIKQKQRYKMKQQTGQNYVITFCSTFFFDFFQSQENQNFNNRIFVLTFGVRVMTTRRL